MLKVLIVEDDVLLADMLEGFLLSQNYNVCGIAHTVDEAVELADLHQPDLAVLDFRLGNGEYGSHIRPLLKEKRGMGILYVSGDPLDQRLTQEDGDGYIQKPYQLDDLLSCLSIVRGLKIKNCITGLPHPRTFQLLKAPGDRRDRIDDKRVAA